MGVLPPAIKRSPYLSARDQIQAGPGSLIKNSPRVQVGEQSEAKNTRIESGGDINRQDVSSEECSDPLYHVMVQAGIASNKKKAAGLLDVNSTLKKESYEVQEALDSPTVHGN